MRVQRFLAIPWPRPLHFISYSLSWIQLLIKADYWKPIRLLRSLTPCMCYIKCYVTYPNYASIHCVFKEDEQRDITFISGREDNGRDHKSVKCYVYHTRTMQVYTVSSKRMNSETSSLFLEEKILVGIIEASKCYL